MLPTAVGKRLLLFSLFLLCLLIGFLFFLGSFPPITLIDIHTLDGCDEDAILAYLIRLGEVVTLS